MSRRTTRHTSSFARVGARVSLTDRLLLPTDRPKLTAYLMFSTTMVQRCRSCQQSFTLMDER